MSESVARGDRVWRAVAMVAVLAISSLNGLLWSPLYDVSDFYVRRMTFGMGSIEPVGLALNGGFLTLLTASAGGIPAALYERMARGRARPLVTFVIWAIGAGLAALPGLLGLTGYFDIVD
ncbi:MAG: hypothetical protein JSS20_05485 [Proteobacteria bacterium]|nr:hypothetical protein [Pseudomonadota bacterium]